MNYPEFKKISKLFSKYSENAQKAVGKPKTEIERINFNKEKILQNYYNFDIFTYAIVDVSRLKIDSVGGAISEMTGYQKDYFENKGLIAFLKLHTTIDMIHSLIGSHYYYKYLYSQPGQNRGLIKSNRVIDIIKKNGEKVHSLIQSIPVLLNDDYEIIKFIVIATDISKLRIARTYKHYIIDSSNLNRVKKIDIKYFSVDEKKDFGPSPSEKKVLSLMAEGFSSKQIANRLFLSEHTIKNHRKNMLKRLNCQSSSELVRMATVHGWI
nr:PAS domain-containing protein [Cytophagales bacterium]